MVQVKHGFKAFPGRIAFAIFVGQFAERDADEFRERLKVSEWLLPL